MARAKKTEKPKEEKKQAKKRRGIPGVRILLWLRWWVWRSVALGFLNRERVVLGKGVDLGGRRII